jgi:hypothetical protein
MKFLILFTFSLLSFSCYADSVGHLLWETAAPVERPSHEIGSNSLWLFPGASLHGRASAGAIPIGIIDSGLMITHPQLEGYITDSKDFTGEGLNDEIGHGTLVALIALYGRGSNEPKSSLINAKVVSRSGIIQEGHVIEAINWVTARGAKIVNLSLGFSGTREEHALLCDAMESHPNVLFLAAAGNSGPNVKAYPAACDIKNGLSVGATEETGNPSSYSGLGEIYALGNSHFIKEWAYYYNQAQEMASSGRLDQAKALYQRSIMAEENAMSHYQIGLLNLSEKDISSAIEQLKTAIEIEPALAEAHEMLGAAFFLRGDYAQAEKSLRNAIDLYPDDSNTRKVRARAHCNLGKTLLRLGQNTKAKSEFLEVKRLVPDYMGIDSLLESVAQ